MGWEIDHIKPAAKGGTDDLSNLQPLQSGANAEKGDTWQSPQSEGCGLPSSDCWDCSPPARRVNPS